MTIDLVTIRQQNAERRKLKEAATKGPWSVDAKNFEPLIVRARVGNVADMPIFWLYWHEDMRPANAHFIAHARNDPVEETIDELIQEIERLRDERQSMLMVIKAAARES